MVEVSIPEREDGKKRGFGVIQFKFVSSAAEAIKRMNGKSILGSILIIASF